MTFTVDAYPDMKFEGKVEQIRLAPVSLANVVTYTVVIGADNPMGRLLPGMTANVEIVTGEHKDVVTVPNEALRFQPRGAVQEALVRDSSQTGALQVASDDRSARMLARLKDQLELSEQDLSKIKVALEAEFAAIKSAGPPGAGASQQDMRDQAHIGSPKCCAPSSRPTNIRNTRRCSGRGRQALGAPRCGPMRTARSCRMTFV